ncbi:MAG: hypothetical protein AAF404_19440, partial [Pseudomonadota bacterium]
LTHSLTHSLTHGESTMAHHRTPVVHKVTLITLYLAEDVLQIASFTIAQKTNRTNVSNRGAVKQFSA